MTSYTISPRAMASWFLDANHVVIPVIKHRLCVDYFIHNIAWILSLFCFLWSALATVLAAGSSPYFFYVCIFNAFMIPWLWYGEWSMGDRLAGHSYVYLVGLYWSIISLLWCSAAGYVHIRQGQEFIEETWYEMQAKVLIPYTTQLDQKASLENNSTGIFWLALVTGLIHLHPLGEVWKSLGGMMKLVQLKFSIFLPEAVPNFMLCAAAASYSCYAASIAAFATDDTVSVMLWHAAAALLGLVAIIFSFLARARWGITFASHAFAAVSYAIPAFVLFITSLVLDHRATQVNAWVEGNWETSLKYLVPSRFAALSWEKYAEESQTPMRQAAMTGIFASVLLFASVIMQARCAAVLLSVGPELYVSRTRLEALQEELKNKLVVASAVLPLGPDDFQGNAEGGKPRGMTVVDWAGSAAASVDAAVANVKGSSGSASASAISISASGSNSSSSGSGSSGARFGFSRASDPGTPLRGAAAGYGTLSDGSAAPGSRAAFPPVASRSSDGESGGSTSRGSKYSDDTEAGSDGTISKYSDDTDGPSSTNSSFLPSASAPGSGAPLTGGRGGNVPYPSGMSALTGAIGARVAAIQQYRFLLAMYEKQLEDMNTRVQWPSVGTFYRAFTYGLRQVFASHRVCTVTSILTFIILLGGIGGGLAPLRIQSECGVLGRSPVTRTYSVNVNIEQGIGRSIFGDIFIENMYPFGGIEVEFDHVPVYPEKRTNNGTLEIIAMAADEDDLPSYATLAASVNLTDYIPFANDDDVGGFEFLRVALNPPEDAASKCLGIRIRLTGSLGLLTLRVHTANGMVNISGNVHDLDTNAGAIFSYSIIDALTDSGAILINNGYVDRLNLDPAAGFPSAITARSTSGDIYFNLVSASGITASTGGNIHTATLGSFSAFNCGAAVCGNVYLTTTGYGKVVMNQAFAAYNAYISTEHGDIVATNTGQIIGLVLSMTSIDGDVIMSNMLQASGNETFVKSAGKISGAAVFTNRLYIDAKEDADVSMVAIFLGTANPGALINPALPANTNYSDPGAFFTTARGDISILGIGGNPASEYFASIANLELLSDSGGIKVEVNGGGVNAPYSVKSDKGQAIIEVNGNHAPDTGILGTGSLGRNRIIVFSDKGNVQLSLLPSPL